MDTRIVDHPAGSARATSIGEARVALRRIEEWLGHLERRGVSESTVSVSAFVHTRDGFEHSSAVESLTLLTHPDEIEQKPGGKAPPSTKAAISDDADVFVFPPVGVCERVQVGTEVVEVPDPDAPKIIQERPVYEYRCTEVTA